MCAVQEVALCFYRICELKWGRWDDVSQFGKTTSFEHVFICIAKAFITANSDES